MNLQALINRYPTLYHMAEKDSWPSIKMHGLLSTTAVLNKYGIGGAYRLQLEEQHRPEKVSVGVAGDVIVLRDQKPMAPDRLQQALTGGVTTAEWYRLINRKVFMWAQESRLLRLLNARHYRNLEHDVLTINTASLVQAHFNRILLCPMNSGNTFPIPHHRSLDTFSTITDYQDRPSGAPRKEVVEVVVDYEVLDIANHVIEVRRMRGAQVLGHIPL